MIEFGDNGWTFRTTNPAVHTADRRQAFVPELTAGEDSAASALMALAEHYVALLQERVAKAPAKAHLALLGALGVEPIASQPARCPVVFEMMQGAGHAHAPEQTPLLAQPVDGGEPLPFETESAIALAGSRLVEAKAVLPGNRYCDHTADMLGEKPFQLFSDPQTIPRELYLAHDSYFAVTAGSSVEIRVEAGTAAAGRASEPLSLEWSYFDGDAWTSFAPFGPSGSASTSEDTTQSLTRTGTIRLRTFGNSARPTTIRGVKAHWIRARVAARDGEPPQLSHDVPSIRRMMVRSLCSATGFHVARRIETLPVKEYQRTVRVRLADESGGLLDSTQYELKCENATVEAPGEQPSSADCWTVSMDWSAGASNHGIAIVRISSKAKVPLEAPFEISIVLPDGRDLEVDLVQAGRLPKVAFANGVKADVTTSFQPFGPAPQPGASLLVACPEAFDRPGASISMYVDAIADSDMTESPTVSWQYWNGLTWAPLPDVRVRSEHDAKAVLAFQRSGEVRFAVPANMALREENGETQRWIRVNMVFGSYSRMNEVRVNAVPIKFPIIVPPTVRRLRLAYDHQSAWDIASGCLTNGDFQWEDKTIEAAFGGTAFEPFRASSDIRPALYLGFSRSLPNDVVSLFVNVDRNIREPELLWEYHDGLGWRSLALDADETRGLSEPGMVRFVWPGTPRIPEPEPIAIAQGKSVTFLDRRVASRYRSGDEIAIWQDELAESGVVASVAGATVTLQSPLQQQFAASAVAGPSSLARFGVPRHWIRVVWPRVEVPLPGDADATHVRGIYLNAVWAAQAKTVTNETLGSTTGQGGETLDLMAKSILQGEVVEVLELAGPLAEAGWPSLLKDLQASGLTKADLRLENDERTGKAVRAWVRWEGRSSFSGSSAADRHYVVDRIRGQVQFGDGRAGKVPPPLPNNVRIRYRTGGGLRGNVPVGAVNVVLGSVTVAQRVFNPIAATGGAAGELARAMDPRESILRRGSQTLRHRNRAWTVRDYEQLALAASPGVAAARVATVQASRGLAPTGSVHVVILPYADAKDPQPQPSRQMCATVLDYLIARSPASVGPKLSVGAPKYVRIGVEAALAPISNDDAGVLSRKAKEAIAEFLHPVIGGTSGKGWNFGQPIFRSDLAKFLHSKLQPYLSFVGDLRLVDAGTPVAEVLRLPKDALPCAGTIRTSVSNVGGNR